jgi:hypothetical protein
MREKRGRLGRTVGALADSIASAARRTGPRAREPRVVVYDAAGHATLLRPESPEHARIVELADRMVALWGEPQSGSEADSA